MYARLSFTSLLKAETTTHAASSADRDTAVAIATPVAPICGTPNNPKINTAFSSTFRVNANIFKTIHTVTLPTLRSTAIYISVMLQHR